MPGYRRLAAPSADQGGSTVRAEITITGTRLTSSGETGVLERRFELYDADDKLVQSGRIDLMVTCRPEVQSFHSCRREEKATMTTTKPVA